MKKDEAEKPLPAPNYYQVNHLQASAVRLLTQSLAAPRPLECQVCGSRWPKKSALIQHMRVHTGEKPYHCSYCPRSFRQKGHVTDHEKMHRGERPHSCPHCPKTYIKASVLREHIRRTHLRLRLYDCPDCPEKFFTSSRRLRHRIRHHGAERAYPCSNCDKKFLTRGTLNKHLKGIHGILLPYACSKCDQKFRLQNEMLCHEGTHEEDDDPKAVKTSTTKQSVKLPVSQPVKTPAKSQKNKNKVKSQVLGAKVPVNQQKENSGSKLIKQNKSSKPAVLEKRNNKSNEEISVINKVKNQMDNLVEKQKVEKFSKKKKLQKADSKNEIDSIKAPSLTNKIQTIELEPPAGDEKDKSSSKKKYHCCCGKSYKSIEKFQRHKARNNHQDKNVILQQPPPSADVKEIPSKKIRLENKQVKNKKRENKEVSPSSSSLNQVPNLNASVKQKTIKSVPVPVPLATKNKIQSPQSAATVTDKTVQNVKGNKNSMKKKKASVAFAQKGGMNSEKEDSSILYQVQKENVNSEVIQVEKSDKKKKPVETKTDDDDDIIIEEPPPKKQAELVDLTADDDDNVGKAEVCDKSFKKKYNCNCGKSYKSFDKFQAHQKRRGHDNEEQVEAIIQQQSPSSQHAAFPSLQVLTPSNQGNKEYRKDLVVGSEKMPKNKKKKEQQLNVNASKVVKGDRTLQVKMKEFRDSENQSSELLPTASQTSTISRGENKNKKRKKQDNIGEFQQEEDEVEIVGLMLTQSKNKVKPSAKYDLQKKIKTEKVNEDEKTIPNNELKGGRTSKVKQQQRNENLNTGLSQTTTQSSTISRGEKKNGNSRKECSIGESRRNEVEIVAVKLASTNSLKEKCNCGELFSCPEELQRHQDIEGHHIQKTYRCFCSLQVFNTLEDFRSHLWANHASH